MQQPCNINHAILFFPKNYITRLRIILQKFDFALNKIILVDIWLMQRCIQKPTLIKGCCAHWDYIQWKQWDLNPTFVLFIRHKLNTQVDMSLNKRADIRWTHVILCVYLPSVLIYVLQNCRVLDDSVLRIIEAKLRWFLAQNYPKQDSSST